MPLAVDVDALSVVCIGRSADVLGDIARPGVDLAAWQRGAEPPWTDWLENLPAKALPTCRGEVAPAEAAAALHASFDAGGTPSGTRGSAPREALLDDISGFVATFISVAQARTVLLRLDLITGDACYRWHRDCVPLRLICTYRGPGTQWVPPGMDATVLARLDDDAQQAMAMQTGDVAMFKGCGWTGQPHDGGIVHRSPRVSGTGIARLVLVLDLPPSALFVLAARSPQPAHHHRP